MANTHAIAVDLAKVYAIQTPEQFEKPIRYLEFGDEIKVEEIAEKHLRVRTRIFTELPDGSVKFEMGSGFIVPKKKSEIRPQDVVRPLDQNNVLRVEFVDVQQGDGALLVMPSKRVMVIDGGDNQRGQPPPATTWNRQEEPGAPTWTRQRVP